MDDRQLAETLTLAEHLCPSMNGASADRFTNALEAAGANGFTDLDGLATDDREWIEAARQQILSDDLNRWSDRISEMRANGVSIVTNVDEGYPTNLRMVHNLPPVLFFRGDLTPDDSRAIAVVGTRDASPEGTKTAEHLVTRLVQQDVTILSGLAAGIDAAAHAAALNAGGRTVAVFGTGIHRVYPQQNRRLADAIARAGACVSQFLPDQAPTRWSFPVRNIVTSGLSLGTVVVEAGPTSGAKHQAHAALQHGKRLFLLRHLVKHQDWARKLAEQPGVQAVDDVDEILAAVDVELDPEPTLL